MKTEKILSTASGVTVHRVTGIRVEANNHGATEWIKVVLECGNDGREVEIVAHPAATVDDLLADLVAIDDMREADDPGAALGCPPNEQDEGNGISVCRGCDRKTPTRGDLCDECWHDENPATENYAVTTEDLDREARS